MPKFVISGGKKLVGEIQISGSKNAILPILAASILTKKQVTLYNVPDIEDVKTTIKILRFLGCKVSKKCDKIVISSANINKYQIPKDLMKKCRSSIILVGALIGRFKKAEFYAPGGCNIGSRPIDLHIEAFKKLGVNVKKDFNSGNKITCIAENIIGTEINLKFPSVGATENIILSSVYAKGITTIKNAAKEPEIKDLANFLNKMGARIYGAGKSTIKIIGIKDLKEASYRIMPDRIETGSYLCFAAITHGFIKLNNVNPKDLMAVLYKLKEIGCKIIINNNNIILKAPKKLKSTNIETGVYPGFPTDMEPLLTSLLTIANGESIIKENIFENRFEFCKELEKMGANILVDNKEQTAIIHGVNNLKNSNVSSKDLRGGASLIEAALSANGVSVIDNAENVLRGYENIDKKLKSLGADIKLLY